MDRILKHPHFDLYLHNTAVLEQLLGVKILQRETIHDWPLSTVQSLTCADGRRLMVQDLRRWAQEASVLRTIDEQAALCPAIGRSATRRNG